MMSMSKKLVSVLGVVVLILTLISFAGRTMTSPALSTPVGEQPDDVVATPAGLA